MAHEWIEEEIGNITFGSIVRQDEGSEYLFLPEEKLVRINDGWNFKVEDLNDMGINYLEVLRGSFGNGTTSVLMYLVELLKEHEIL